MPPGLYEKKELRDLTDGALRPGGLRLTRLGLELCCWSAGDLVLDVGCGPGASLEMMRGMGLAACGLDSSALLLREAARHGPAIMGEAEHLPFADAALDGVSVECVLSLLSDKAAALQEIRRVLKPGGRLLLSDIFLKKDAAEKTGDSGQSCFIGLETLPRLQEMLEEAGFKLLHCRDESQSLVQMAVNMIFTYGSVAEFFRRWNPEDCAGRGQGKNFGYALCIARPAA